VSCRRVAQNPKGEPEMSMGKRTIIIKFSRQLRPQPPKGSHPYWWGIGDLDFIKNGKVVWHQEIPEASNFYNKNFYDWLKVPRIYLNGCQVEHDKDWGWILKFEASHQEAHKIYEFLFKHHPEYKVSYTENDGTQIVKRKKRKGVLVGVEEKKQT